MYLMLIAMCTAHAQLLRVCLSQDMWEMAAVTPKSSMGMQAKDWADPDAGKVHKSRLEREKEAAAAARSALV